MPGTTSSMNLKMQNKGFILTTDDQLTPRIIPTPKDMCGLDNFEEILYIFAMDVIYKFQCEDFDTFKFARTQEFITAHYQKHTLQNKPWFPSAERKLLNSDPEMFYSSFKLALKKDLESYYGNSAKPLVELMIKELEKVEL